MPELRRRAEALIDGPDDGLCGAIEHTRDIARHSVGRSSPLVGR
jgi:hypothetical protein